VVPRDDRDAVADQPVGDRAPARGRERFTERSPASSQASTGGQAPGRPEAARRGHPLQVTRAAGCPRAQRPRKVALVIEPRRAQSWSASGHRQARCRTRVQLGRRGMADTRRRQKVRRVIRPAQPQPRTAPPRPGRSYRRQALQWQRRGGPRWTNRSASAENSRRSSTRTCQVNRSPRARNGFFRAVSVARVRELERNERRHSARDHHKRSAEGRERAGTRTRKSWSKQKPSKKMAGRTIRQTYEVVTGPSGSFLGVRQRGRLAVACEGVQQSVRQTYVGR